MSSTHDTGPYTSEDLERWAQESLEEYESSDEALDPPEEISDAAWCKKQINSRLKKLQEPYPVDPRFYLQSQISQTILKKQETSSDLHASTVEELRRVEAPLDEHSHLIGRLWKTTLREFEKRKSIEARLTALESQLSRGSVSLAITSTAVPTTAFEANEDEGDNDDVGEGKRGLQSTPLRVISVEDDVVAQTESGTVASSVPMAILLAEMEAQTCSKEDAKELRDRCRPYLRTLYHRMIGMNYKSAQGVVDEPGFLPYVNGTPAPTTSGKFVIPDSRVKVFRPQLSDPSSASHKSFLDELMKIARPVVKKDIPTPIIEETIRAFIKTRVAGQRRIDDPVIGAQRKITQSTSRRKSRMQSDVTLRQKYWDTCPLAKMPKGDLLKKLLVDTATIPERLHSDDETCFRFGKAEFTHYANSQLGDADNVFLLREVTWLPPNLTRLVAFYDEYCRKAANRDSPGGRCEQHRLGSLPKRYWMSTKPTTLPAGLQEGDLNTLEKLKFLEKVEKALQKKSDAFLEQVLVAAEKRLESPPSRFIPTHGEWSDPDDSDELVSDDDEACETQVMRSENRKKRPGALRDVGPSGPKKSKSGP